MAGRHAAPRRRGGTTRRRRIRAGDLPRGRHARRDDTRRRPAAGRLRRAAGVAALASLVTCPLVASPLVAPASAADAGVTSYGVQQTRCRVTDRRLKELSGLAATAGAVYVVNDTAPVTLWRLDAGCHPVQKLPLTVPAPADPLAPRPAPSPSETSPSATDEDAAPPPPPGKVYDLEDLASTTDGALWVADIGGNTTRRRVVSLYRWTPGTSLRSVERFDLRYPDGAHDAEALLLSLSGQAVVVTKASSGVSGLYAARLPLAPSTVLTRVGRLDLRTVRAADDTTPRSLLVTGGASSPDGVHVALRTYTSAYEWDLPDGDVVRALTQGRPRVVRLAQAAQGEAIAYTEDGATLLTGGERVPAPVGAVAITRTPPALLVSERSAVRPPMLVGGLAAAVALAGAGALMARRRKPAARPTVYQSDGSPPVYQSGGPRPPAR